MGYTKDRSFKSLYDESYVEGVSEDIVDRVGDSLRDGVAKRTPVARLPAAYKGDFEAWIEDRGGRKPRTLRDSWKRTDAIREGDNLSVTVDSTDPQTAVWVEWDTKPHLIRAKMRVSEDGGLRQGSLRFPDGPVFRYATEVWHPGTQGVHMMRDTLTEIEASWEVIGERVLDEHAAAYDEEH